jgi:WD40 repeat protein
LATAGLDRTVRPWHPATGLELLAFKGLPHQINGLAFTSDGNMLAAAVHDDSVKLWRAASAYEANSER